MVAQRQDRGAEGLHRRLTNTFFELSTTKVGNSVGIFVKPAKHAVDKEGGTPFLTSTRPNLFPETRGPARDSLLCSTTVDNRTPYCACISISALAPTYCCVWAVCLRSQHDEVFVVSSSRSSGTPSHVPIDIHRVDGQLFSAARDCVFAANSGAQRWCTVKYPGDHEVYFVETCVCVRAGRYALV